MRRERKQKRKFICWIAQLFNLRESSTFFSSFKKKKYKSQAFATWFANNAGGMEELFGEGERYFPKWQQRSTPIVLHWMHLRLCRDSAGLSHHGDDTGVLEHLVCASNIAKTRYQSLFLEGLLWIEPSVRLQGLALFYQNCSVWFMNCIVKHYLSTFQKSFYFPLLCPLLSSPLSPLLSSLSPLFSLLCLSWAVTKPL